MNAGPMAFCVTCCGGEWGQPLDVGQQGASRGTGALPNLGGTSESSTPWQTRKHREDIASGLSLVLRGGGTSRLHAAPAHAEQARG